ncbi:MAG: tetraacyldisaccharide 4'-kinase [Omnitrophica WOR_2 bacterium RIFCSPLOWO2_12_FULL_46_30]|nr:MAG: tetraacyldisaccharide 4'-kinase [Omnitrophica WOR_2 bacterium RIFCSPHIGHO2_02_FULL_46_37]OGX43668.1 MAG: tetraacyldisaccharide 4'-kinase [Omnitrophica WOR_2 bacterium RIFCSPLOWO2_02_FULL_45_28]OGX51951.1 MAG: tetraacyldisaccharide 4'-kinase [Omnitrophica WOR_2 bacterium RIFCSPLOWO2_12_FULL_46_30]
MRNYFYNLAAAKPEGNGLASDSQSHKPEGNACLPARQGLASNSQSHQKKGCLASIIRLFLLVLSCFYGLLIRILRLFYSRAPLRFNCKVISVGNITWGGTGKTPLVECIARYLKEKGHKIAILSRGYKRKNRPLRGAQIASSKTMGDEPYMLSRSLGSVPVIVDAQRARGAAWAVKGYGVEAVLLDDGFQQWRIKKDLEIVVIDAASPFGNRHMIPRGVLREPLSALRRADIFVLTKINLLSQDTSALRDFLRLMNPQAEIFESAYEPMGFYLVSSAGRDDSQPGRGALLNVDALRGKTVTLVSGIANPDSFEHLIRRLGIGIGLSFQFPDHYAYQEPLMEDIVKKSRAQNIDTIVTTEKDSVRMPAKTSGAQISIFALRIELKITNNEKEFFNRISGVFTN